MTDIAALSPFIVAAPACVLALTLGLGACGDSAPTSLPTNTEPWTVQLSATEVAFAALGETRQLTAQVSDGNGSPAPTATVAWSSSDDSVATVDTAGLITSVSNGTALITASSHGATATAQVSVSQVVASISTTGGGQFRQHGSELPVPLVLTAVDALGNGVASEAVSFRVVAGGGSLSEEDVVTDTAGRASSRWTVGEPGSEQAVTVTAGAFEDTLKAESLDLTLTMSASVSADDRLLTSDSITAAASVSGYAVHLDSIKWSSSLGASLGRGADLLAAALQPGEQRLIVDVLGARADLPVRVFGDLLSLYLAEPSAAEVARIQADFDLRYVDGPGADEQWAPYGYSFDLNSPQPSRLAIVSKLDALRRQRFSAAPPFLDGMPTFYEWVRAQIDTIELRLDCGLSYGGGGMMSLGRGVSHWDGRSSTDCKTPFSRWSLVYYTWPDYLVVHEARHSHPDDPRHVVCGNGIAGDAALEPTGGYGFSALYAMWVYKYSTVDPKPVRDDARSLSVSLLGRICATPTHSNPLVQAILDELLGDD